MRNYRFWVKVLSLAIILTLFAGFLTPGEAEAVSPAVFINEIHYDNSGTDANEAVEIAGPAGTDLTGWSLVLYNGNGGASYSTVSLSGSIPDLDNGHGVLEFATPGIQNGSPDGLALVDPGSSVIQFLSYEGSFVAIDGPAIGMTSTDIVVSEEPAPASGQSLQLSGSGVSYDDFTWSGPSTSTFGSVNTGQTFTSEPPLPTLVINEIDYDQSGTDTAEFIEIKNTGGSAVNLSNATLELVNGNGGGATLYNTINLPATNLAPGDYFVICGDPANVAQCDLDVSPDSNLIQNGAPDAVGLRYNGELLDAVSYEGDSGAPYTESSGSGLLDNPDVEYASISRYPDGVDTDVNNVDLSLRCATPGAENSNQISGCVPPETNLVINEIDYDQPSTDTAEYIEILNLGSQPADLNGWTLELVNGTGGGASIYQTIDLGGYSLSAGDYFVVCANNSTVANCDLDVSPDTNLIQNGAPDAVGLRFNGSLIDAVSYEGDSGSPYTEGSGTGLEDTGDGSISRCPDGTDTNQNNADFSFGAITPGASNDCPPPPPPEMCGDPSLIVSEIQGSGLFSPFDGQEVAVEGVVTGDFQYGGGPDSGDLGGFYIQDTTDLADADPLTSDGVFVYDPSGMDVAVGDKVRVRGIVDEYVTNSGASSMTEIKNIVQVWNCGTADVPTPVDILLPVTSINDFEAYEGMLVKFPQALHIGEYFNFDRFNEIILTTTRQYQPTAVFEPGSLETTVLTDLNARSRIMLDDGRSSQNSDPAIHPNGLPFDLSNLFRGGDTVQAVTGVLDETFSYYRIQPTQYGTYTAINTRPTSPDPVGGNLKVASFNVLNYFTTLDDGVNDICGPSLNQECRGADNAEEFTRQRNKIISALSTINADVVGLIEIENNPYEAVADLVSGLNDVLGPGTYDYVDTGYIGTDAIKVALIYKPASVSLVGTHAILDSSVDTRFLDDKNRPVLAQTFIDTSTGGIFTVAVNHLKSKGSDCNDVVIDGAYDVDTGDGQGNCNLTRREAAAALVDWLASDPTSSGDSDYLIIGDLNSYDKEDPIDVLVGAGYTDLINAKLGEYAYSYLFDGQLGYLDYALASPGLVGEVTGTTVWHINADEPDLIDYDTSFKQPAQDAIYAPDAYRSSDHDPVIVGLNLIPPIVDVTVTPDTLWSPNHKYIEVSAVVSVMGGLDPNPIITLVSVVSNEADNGLGDGDTPDDIVVVDDFNFLLRAERAGGGEGRIYTITYKVTDSNGDAGFFSATVTVPKSQGK